MNIFAYTGLSKEYPPYISINDQGGKTSIIVRSAGHNGTKVAECPVSDADLKELSDKITLYLASKSTLKQHFY